MSDFPSLEQLRGKVQKDRHQEIGNWLARTGDAHVAVVQALRAPHGSDGGVNSGCARLFTGRFLVMGLARVCGSPGGFESLSRTCAGGKKHSAKFSLNRI